MNYNRKTMESFFRYISYIEFYENAKKKHTSGYIIWRYQEGVHRLEIHLKDEELESRTLEILEEGSGLRIGEISVYHGTGDCRIEFSSYDGEEYILIQEKKIHLSEITGIQIYLSEEERLVCKISLPVEKIKEEERILPAEKIKEERILQSEKVKEEKSALPSEKIKEESTLPQEAEVLPVEKDKNQEIKSIEEEKRNQEIKIVESEKTYQEIKTVESDKTCQEVKYLNSEKNNEEIQIIKPPEEDKWKQLCRSYPVVHPFSSKRGFISVTLQDFIILQEKYQRLVHNSFLLHGYYNYGHLILGKLEDKAEAPYYIGVPGVYYEREKRAAKMFGFVGFEGTDHVIENGSYGYYMIEVEI